MVNQRCPLVSVVVPTVRVDGMLRESLDSLLSQDYEALEVIVVIDGAPNFERPEWARDARVRWLINEERQGTPRALNRGLAEASGDFIARLDADDISLPGRLKAQVEFLDSHPDVDCVGTGVMVVDTSGALVKLSEASPERPDDIATRLLRRNCITHSSVMYRPMLLERLGGYAPEMTRMQDYELFLRMACAGKLANIPVPYVAYRVHDGQHSRKSSPWAPYTRTILRRRLQLALALNQSVFMQVGRNLLWFLAQLSRHYGIRKPRYMTGNH